MWTVLPIDSASSDYLVYMEFGGSWFGFRVYWNERSASWYADIYDDEDVPLLLCKRIATGSLLTRSVREFPGGVFVVSVDDRELRDPTRTNLGTDILLMHYSDD